MSVEREKPSQIIAVDGQSTDGTLRILKKHRIKVLSEAEGSYGYSRQLGVNAAKSPYVMFVDSDVELSPGCIMRLREEMEEFGWIGIHAMILSSENASYWQSAANREWSLWINHPGPKPYVACAAALFRREILLRHPFDPNLKDSCEDLDLCLRLGGKGYIVGVSHAYMHHHHRYDFHGFAKQRFRYGLGRAQLALKYKSIRLLANGPIRAVGAIPHYLGARMHKDIPYLLIGTFVSFAGTIVGLSKPRRQRFDDRDQRIRPLDRRITGPENITTRHHRAQRKST